MLVWIAAVEDADRVFDFKHKTPTYYFLCLTILPIALKECKWKLCIFPYHSSILAHYIERSVYWSFWIIMVSFQHSLQENEMQA